MVLGFFVVYFSGPLVFYAYGFDPNLIGSSDFEAFIAYDKTIFARRMIFYVFVAITLLTHTLSWVIIFIDLKVNRSLVYVVGVISFVILIIFGIASTIPQRIV